MPRKVLDKAEQRDDSWSWLARWVDSNPVEWLFRGKREDGKAECAKLERDGFKRTGIGLYSASVAARRKTKIREVRFYLDKRDPNKVFKRVVMDARWPSLCRKTFEAAASQRKAFNCLGQVAHGDGSISSHDWHLKILAAQTKNNWKVAERLTLKHAASILQTPRGRRWLLENREKALRAPPELREWTRRKYREFYNRDVRRLGRKKADEKWKGKNTLRFKQDTHGDKIAVVLTTHWLAVGNKGFPGLCFLSDELLAQLLGYTLPLPSLLSDGGWKFVRTIRERVGLKKAEILFNGIEEVGYRKWAILDRNGTKTHWISFRPNKPLPPKL